MGCDDSRYWWLGDKILDSVMSTSDMGESTIPRQEGSRGYLKLSSVILFCLDKGTFSSLLDVDNVPSGLDPEMLKAVSKFAAHPGGSEGLREYGFRIWCPIRRESKYALGHLYQSIFLTLLAGIWYNKWIELHYGFWKFFSFECLTNNHFGVHRLIFDLTLIIGFASLALSSIYLSIYSIDLSI